MLSQLSNSHRIVVTFRLVHAFFHILPEDITFVERELSEERRSDKT